MVWLDLQQLLKCHVGLDPPESNSKQVQLVGQLVAVKAEHTVGCQQLLHLRMLLVTSGHCTGSMHTSYSYSLLVCTPVPDLRQACSPLEVPHKQVLDSTVGAARQKHGDGFPVVAITTLGLQTSAHRDSCSICQQTGLLQKNPDWVQGRLLLHTTCALVNSC